MFTPFLLLATAQAGVVSELSPEELHLAQCVPSIEEALQKFGPQGEIDAWKECLAGAKTQSLAPIVPKIQGHIVERELNRDYATMREEDPIQYAKVVLATAAQNPNASLPMETLRSQWQLLLDDTQTRANMSDFHSIAVRFIPHSTVDEETLVLLDDHLRRRIADLGIRTPTADSQDAAEAPIVVQVSPFFEELEPTVQDERGRLHKVGFQLKTNGIRFKARDTRRGGFRVGHSHEDAHQSVAIDESIDGVTIKFADAFLTILIRESFSRYPIPAP